MGTQDYGLPKVFTYDYVRIVGADPTKKQRFQNPLRTFVYNRKVEGTEDLPNGELSAYFASWKQTYRWATGRDDPREDYMELDE